MAVHSRLNPKAPEFFPTRHLLSFPVPPSPSNFSIYYSPPLLSPSPRLPFPQTPPISNDRFIPAATQPLHEPPAAASPTPSGGKRGSRRWYTKRHGRGYGCHSKEHSWRPKHDASNDNNCSQEKNSDCLPGSSKGDHPVLAAEPNGLNTTCMIKNIPNRYTRELLMDFLDEHCRQENEKEEPQVSAYDFLYLPIDFKSKANKGFAFVNFTNPKGVMKFKEAVNNKRWPLFSSKKVCSIGYARVQGKEELVKHFEGSVFECESDDYLPVSFRPARDGCRASVELKVIGRRV